MFIDSPRLTAGTYQVPDESEIEISSDEDIESSPEMEYTHRVLKEHGIRPAPIDLTSDNESPAAIPTYHEQSRRGVDTPPHPTSTQDHYMDLTLPHSEPVPALQNEVEVGAGVEVLDMNDDREYSGDEVRWDDDESVGDVPYDDIDDSDDSSAQLDLHDSDEPTLAVDGESDNNAQGKKTLTPLPSFDVSLTLYTVEDLKGPFHSDMHQVGQNGFDPDVLPPIRPSQPCDILPPISSAPVVGREAISDFYERADNLGRMANPTIYPGYQFPPIEPACHYPAVRSDNQLTEPPLAFLDYPQPFGFPTAVPIPRPDYDDTSAFSYEQSKKRIHAPLQPSAGIEASGQDDVSHVNRLQEVSEVPQDEATIPRIQHAPKRTLEEISQSTPEEEHLISIQKAEAEGSMVENSEVAPITTPKPEPSPTKRNIDEISDAEPEKEQSLLASKRKKTSEPKLSDPIAILNDAPELILPSRHSLASCQAQARPAKRLKKAAEVFGYVALGGVAVMSALIATAPAL